MKRRKRDWFLLVGAAYLLLLLLFAVFGPAIRTAQLRDHAFTIAKAKNPQLEEADFKFDAVLNEASPRQFAPPDSITWLGTDELNRDVVARLAAGARVSLTVGLTVQVVAVVVGVGVGVLGVFGPPWLRQPLLRFTDGMFAFPDILLAILIIGIVGMGMGPVIAALSVTAWPSIARLVVTKTASIKDREFVVAAKASGARTWYLVTRHVLPQLMGIVLAYSMIELAGTILAESTLSFLGIGVQEPSPSWGNMIQNARINMASHPIMLVWPCLILSLTIFALNFVGDGLQTLLDPKADQE